jgi:hypothetical protein
VFRPQDPVAFWDLEVAASDVIWHEHPDEMYSCANYVAQLPGVTDVPYEGGEVIPVCGSIDADQLQRLVREWWHSTVTDE